MEKKKLLVTFSGGETSAFMAQWLWKHKQDEFDMLFVFANTGQENNETLDFVNKCQNHFNIKIHWIEAKVYHNQKKATGFKLVDYRTATRITDWIKNNETPFEEVIKKYGIPNHSRLHCTRELKMNPIKEFAQSIWGKEKYYIAIGIRSDEFDRMNHNYKKLRIVYPLISREMIPSTKKHINFYWKNQPFRLNLKGYQGNCVACYKKGDNKLYKLIQEDDNSFRFFESMENMYGNPNGIAPSKDQELSKKDYKNVFYRNYRSATDLIKESRGFTGSVKNDSDDANIQMEIDTESCDVYSGCGE